MNYGWEVLDKSICHDGFFRLERYRLRHELFAGGWSGELVRELLVRGHAVAVLLYDPIRDQVVLVEQFRIGALASGEHPWMLEVVAESRRGDSRTSESERGWNPPALDDAVMMWSTWVLHEEEK